jgi:hypothetical protein
MDFGSGIGGNSGTTEYSTAETCPAAAKNCNLAHKNNFRHLVGIVPIGSKMALWTPIAARGSLSRVSRPMLRQKLPAAIRCRILRRMISSAK